MNCRPLSIGFTFLLATHAQADITRVATFENFGQGQVYNPSFLDPLSGITFSNSTGPIGGFVIGYGLQEFGNSNYLGSGSTGPSWSFQFGFTAMLQAFADDVSVDVSTGGIQNGSGAVLQCFNTSNVLVGQQSGPNDTTTDPFILNVHSAQYDIAYFKMVATKGIATGYDNVSYTTNVPEPSSLLMMLGIATLLSRRLTRQQV